MSRKFRGTEDGSLLDEEHLADWQRSADRLEARARDFEEASNQVKPLETARLAIAQALDCLNLPASYQEDWEVIQEDMSKAGAALEADLPHIADASQKEAHAVLAEINLMRSIIHLFLSPEGEENAKYEYTTSLVKGVEMLNILTRPSHCGNWVELWRRDHVKTTIRLCERALEHLDLVGAHQTVARRAVAHITLGNAYFDLRQGDRRGNLNRAIEYLEAGIVPGEGKDRARYPRQWALAQQSLGNCYAERGDFYEAERCYKQAFTTQVGSGSHAPAEAYPVDAAVTANNWAIILMQQGAVARYQEAVDKLEYAHQRFAAARLSAYCAATSYNLGRAHALWAEATAKQEQEELMRKAYERALAESRQDADNPFYLVELVANRHWGRHVFKSKDWPAAYKKYVEAIASLEALHCECITEQGQYALARQNARLYSEATYAYSQLVGSEQDKTYRAALELLEHGQARLLTEMMVQPDTRPRVADPEEFITEKQRARLGHPEGRITARQRDEFVTLRQRHRELQTRVRNEVYTPKDIEALKETREALTQCVAALEAANPDLILTPQSLSYTEIRELLPTDGVKTAFVYFNVTEHGSQIFVVLSEGAMAGLDTTSWPGNPIVEDDLCVFSADFNYANLMRLLFAAEGQAKTWIEACENRIDDPEAWDQAVLAMRGTTEIKAGWAVLYQLYRHNRALSPWWRAKITEVGEHLYDTLFKDVDALLQAIKCQRIIFIPQLGLRVLPLHAMRDSGGQYLIEKYAEIAFAPCAAILQSSKERLQKREKHEEDLLGIAVGNGEKEQEAFDQTIDEIAKLFEIAAANAAAANAAAANADAANADAANADTANADTANMTATSVTVTKSSKSMKAAQATEDQVVTEAALYKTIVFLCHGMFDFNNPLQSGLRLVKPPVGEQYDGRLILAELYDTICLPAASLVTLAACESGLVDHNSPADEFIGLPGGFLYAGTASVIGSLWKVEQSSTQALAKGIHTGLFGGQTPAKTLCQAQRDLQRQPLTQEPFYWAPFYFCGGCESWWR